MYQVPDVHFCVQLYVYKNKKPIRKFPLPSYIQKLSVVPPLIWSSSVMPVAINSAFRLVVKCVGKELAVDSGSLFQHMIEQARSGKVNENNIVWLDSARVSNLFPWLRSKEFTIFEGKRKEIDLIRK